MSRKTTGQGGAADSMAAASRTRLLRIGCSARSAHGSDSGRLIVEPGAVRFWSDKAGTPGGIPTVLHVRPPLIFVRARLLPPGLNSSLRVEEGDGAVTILTWWGTTGRVKRALAAAEVAFFERVTWVSIGDTGDGAVTRLPRGSAAE